MIRRQQHFEAACLAEFDPPILISRPNKLLAPVLFCSPHSGKHYPADFIARSDQPLISLRRNEDAFVDDLLAPATAFGAPLLCARFPRAFVDVNRSPEELPARWLARGEQPTIRAEAGLGVIPTMLSETQPIYRRALKPSAAEARLRTLYYPYHKALQNLAAEAQSRFGQAVIIDCHSMPGFTPSGSRRADIILGDRYGTSCRPETIARIEALFNARGLQTARNYPYAGGYVTSHYGQPHDDVEAIQIEINRDLYLNPVTLKPKRSYNQLADILKSVIGDIVENWTPQAVLAAE